MLLPATIMLIFVETVHYLFFLVSKFNCFEHFSTFFSWKYKY